MLRRTAVFALFAASAAFATAPLLAQDPLAVAAANHKLTLDDERVRSYEFTLKPGGEVPMHSHPDHVVYVLAAGTLRSTDAEGKSTDRTYKIGETIHVPAVAHSLRNTGKSTVRAIVTELKDAATRASLSTGERAEMLDLFRRSTQETLDLVARTPEALWNTKPAPERWSVAEIVEHIGLTEKMLFASVTEAMKAPADPNWALVEAGMGTDQIVGMLQNRTQKFQAPEPAKPTGKLSRAEALAAYGGARAVTVELAKRIDGDMKKQVAPLPGNMKATTHQLLNFIAAHNLRHNAQIAETLEQVQKKAE